jgi:hypothetical protein
MNLAVRNLGRDDAVGREDLRPAEAKHMATSRGAERPGKRGPTRRRCALNSAASDASLAAWVKHRVLLVLSRMRRGR